MAVYTKEYESQPEAILTNVIICPAVDLSANVAVPVHCQVENVLWDTGATNTLISQEVVNALGLQPKNKALISSAGGDVESWTYLVHVILPTGTAELNVQALLNDNSDYDVVIGMDIINSCDFCYTNKDGKSTFSLCHPAKEKIILKKTSHRLSFKKDMCDNNNDRCDIRICLLLFTPIRGHFLTQNIRDLSKT